jgi:choline dehydrogenase
MVTSKQKVSSEIDEICADYVIIGGGTAGAVLANRLSKKKRKVVVLEGGLKQDNNRFIRDPLAAGDLVLAHTNEFFWALGHEKGGTIDNLRLAAVAGEILGGSSSVNGMQFVRGTRKFFNEWEKIAGDKDWGPQNAGRVYKNIETFNGVPGQFNPAAHGESGPVDVRQAVRNLEAAQLFQNALTTLGYPITPDYNDLKGPAIGSFLYWQLTQQPNQNRESSSTAYLDEILHRKSCNVFTGRDGRLVVYTKGRALRIKFDDREGCKYAIGVLADIDGKQVFVRAKHKVILSAGFQSPLLLQLSGIGDKALLKKHCVPLVFDNPNVGRNMLNHPIFVLTGIGDVPLASNPDPKALYDGGAELPDPSRPNQNARGFQLIGIATPSETPGAGAFTIATLLLDAKSRGHIEIINSDPLRMPEFKFNYFRNPDDVDSAIGAYGIMFNTLTTMGLTPLGPNPADTDAVRDFILATFSQAFHWVGSCRMAKSAKHGVVNSDGEVFGVKDLIVADITIIPVNTAGNAMAPAFLVGNIIADKLLS